MPGLLPPRLHHQSPVVEPVQSYDVHHLAWNAVMVAEVVTSFLQTKWSRTIAGVGWKMTEESAALKTEGRARWLAAAVVWLALMHNYTHISNILSTDVSFNDYSDLQKLL